MPVWFFLSTTGRWPAGGQYGKRSRGVERLLVTDAVGQEDHGGLAGFQESLISRSHCKVEFFRSMVVSFSSHLKKGLDLCQRAVGTVKLMGGIGEIVSIVVSLAKKPGEIIGLDLLDKLPVTRP